MRPPRYLFLFAATFALLMQACDGGDTTSIEQTAATSDETVDQTLTEDAFLGVWAPRSDDCGAAAGAEDSRIQIFSTRIVSGDTRCEIERIVRLSGGGNAAAVVTCREGGVPATEVYLRVAGGTMLMEWGDRDTVSLLACPTPEPKNEQQGSSL